MLHILTKYQNAIISYYYNILMTWTTLQPFCVLRTSFDTGFNDLFNDGYDPKRPLQTFMFLQMRSYSGPRGSPDLIFNAFHVTFRDETNGIPPRSSRPQTTNVKTQTTLTQMLKMLQGMTSPPPRRSAGARAPGGSAPGKFGALSAGGGLLLILPELVVWCTSV